MAEEDKDKKVIEESGNTSWGSHGQGISSWFSPLGTLGKWFSKYFASAAKPYIAMQAGEGPDPIPKDSRAGDAVINTDMVKIHTMVSKPGTVYDGPEVVIRNIFVPEYERTRKERYKQLENMDEYPEISSAFDIYADDATQRDTKGRLWLIESDSPVVKDEVERFFKSIDMERNYWDIIRNICKYGDCFTEAVIDENNPAGGIQRLKILNPNYIIRVENIYGYLTAFLQEIPKNINYNAFGIQSDAMGKNTYVTLDKNQITHFRLHTSDPKFYPYGRSVAGGVLRTFRSLKLMEDAMLIYRLSRAPERRVFYIDIGSLPTNKVALFIENMKKKLKKEKYFNTQAGTIDERYNPLSIDEDLFIPHKGGKETKVEVLPGATNLGDIDDVKYFLDKVLGGMKVPRDFIVESKDKGPERKANLSQLDVKFSKTVQRVQQNFVEGLETVTRVHLKIKKVPQHLINTLRIKLPDPSDMFTKRKLEIDEAKSRVVTAMLGTQLFSKDTIYKEYFELSEDEIEKEKKLVEEEQAEMMENGMGGVPGMPGMPGDPTGGGLGDEMGAEEQQAPGVGGRDGNIKKKQPGSAGMDSPANESVKLVNRIILTESDLGKRKILENIKEKLVKLKKAKN